MSLGAAACTHREVLDRPGLRQILAADPELTALRVYLDRPVAVVYPLEEQARALALRGGVVEHDEASEALRQLIGRRSRGAVIATSRGGGELWISFDPTCVAVSCAYHFVAAGDDTYALAAAPTRAGYAPPEVYRRRDRERNRLHLHLVAPEVSADQILALPRRRGPQPITLELRTRTHHRERVDTERARGFDRTGG